MAYRAVPAPTTALVGREQAVATVCALLRDGDARLLTLTGPGGVGKTRLGIAVATASHAQFADGVVWVPLAALDDAALVPTAVTQALDLRAHEDVADRTALVAHLREKRLLLLLDNCEHLVAAVAALVAELLAACPALVVLATSRAPLHVGGEQEVAVPPLPPPDPLHVPALAALAGNPAVRLFVARAHAATGDFALTAANARDVAEICVRLDGLPLALELAAAHCKVLSPEALRTRLGDRLRLLTGGARDLLARQRTVRDTITWSYGLLAPAEQTLLRRLAVFAGGWTLEAAEAVCGDVALAPVNAGVGLGPTAAGSVLEDLAALVDQSLVQRAQAHENSVRFTMLETIRAYAAEQLRHSGETEAMAQRHAAYYRTLAEEGDAGVRGRAQAAWLRRLEEDHDNLRAALHWLFMRGRDGDAAAVEQGMHLAGALYYFWWLHGHAPEGVIWLTRLLALPAAAAHTAGRARAARSGLSPGIYARVLRGESVHSARVGGSPGRCLCAPWRCRNRGVHRGRPGRGTRTAQYQAAVQAIQQVQGRRLCRGQRIGYGGAGTVPRHWRHLGYRMGAHLAGGFRLWSGRLSVGAHPLRGDYPLEPNSGRPARSRRCLMRPWRRTVCWGRPARGRSAL